MAGPLKPILPLHLDMLIAGETSSRDRRLEVRNPAHPDEVVGTVVCGSPEDVNKAMAAAKAAQPAWAALTYAERAKRLATMLDRLEGGVDERAILFVRENGKVVADAKGELASVAPRQRLILELAKELDTPRQMPAPHGRTLVAHRPFGVVVGIVPWNSPVSLAFSQIVAALLAGNSIVIKPPETCPLTLMKTIEIAAAALPPGLINVVTGLPGEIGDALTTHPDVAKIGFTGSVLSARTIMANAARSIKGVTLELGGNDAAILLEDADLGEKKMESMARAVFRMTGQVCMAIKRIYVPEALKDRFVEAFADVVDRIVVGDGLEPGVSMGPLHTAKALERAKGLLAEAEQRGAKTLPLGRIHDPAIFENGHFMRPMIVTEIDDDARLMTEEQFCPAIPVATYRHVDDAIRRANNSIYGFGGSVWSKDIDRAARLALQLEAGAVFVNTHGTESVNRRAPYGGVKQSGIGRRAGMEGVREYLQIQTLTTCED